MIALAALIAASAAPPGPGDFTAQTMRMEPRERRTLLDGAVRLSRGGMVVTGDRAVVEFAPDEQQPQRKPRRRGRDEPALLGQKLERFTVDGNVHVQRGARTADGPHGVYDAKAQTLVLTGTGNDDPVLRDGSETLTGDRILMRLDTEDVDVQKPRLVLRRSVPEAQEAPQLPTRVEAARLSLDRSERLARFTDDVVVRRGDVVVRGPRMDAHYAASGQLTHIYLRGGVELRQGDRRWRLPAGLSALRDNRGVDSPAHVEARREAQKARRDRVAPPRRQRGAGHRAGAVGRRLRPDGREHERDDRLHRHRLDAQHAPGARNGASAGRTED